MNVLFQRITNCGAISSGDRPHKPVCGTTICTIMTSFYYLPRTCYSFPIIHDETLIGQLGPLDMTAINYD
ncbi:hypothetical protein QTP88_004650 [Uroleucon formosanum]